MSIITEDAPACFMWRHKLLWGLNNRVDYKPLPDARIFGIDMKVKSDGLIQCSILKLDCFCLNAL